MGQCNSKIFEITTYKDPVRAEKKSPYKGTNPVYEGSVLMT